MGLDMFLVGEKIHVGSGKEVDGFPVMEERIELAYWRKHPNLHGFIVRSFANKHYEGDDLFIDVGMIDFIIYAVKYNELPETDGFFFGKSRSADQDNTLEKLERAKEWLLRDEENIRKTIYYHASW